MRLLIIFSISLMSLTTLGQLLNPMVDSIAMRDGKKLAADIYLPNSAGTFPVILVQTPYNRLYYRSIGLPLVKFQLQSSHYAFVIVDWRCFYGSSQACVLQPDRGEDGFDVVDWITSQNWSSGKVGTWGPSALGRVQYLTAREKPAGLVCAVPLVAASQYNYLEYFPGGVARTEYIEQLDGLGFGMSGILYDNPVYNNVWAFTENQNYYPEKIEIPLLMIGGWYDHNANVMIELFKGLQQHSTQNVKERHRLLIGPWAHGGFGPAQVGTASQGELSYPNAAGWSDSLAKEFFDHHLRQVNNGWENSPEIQYYLMGENEWKIATSWPPFHSDDTLFLHSEGELSYNKPQNLKISSALIYDPHDPSPTYGGPTLRQDLMQGPYDQSLIVENRNDNLIFSTKTLTKNIRIIGKPQIKLFVSSDRLDTDFVVRLTDVYPDGRSMLLSDGIIRMRFRDGYTANDTSLIIPGVIYPVLIELPELANTFLQGHRLRLIITSSNYPRYDKNLNNGGAMYAAGDKLIATNTIFHDSPYPSFLTFQTDTSYSTTSVSEAVNAIKVFPNPFSDNLFISNTFQAGKIEIRIFDIHGIKIGTYQANSKGSLIPLQINTKENGLFIVQVISADGSFTQKVIRNK